MSIVIGVGSGGSNPRSTLIANSAPAPTAKPKSSSAGFNVGAAGQSIFIKTSPTKDTTITGNIGTTPTKGFNASLEAAITQPLSGLSTVSTTTKLRAVLKASYDNGATSVNGLVGANSTFKFPVSPSTNVSVSGDVSANTTLGGNSVLTAAVGIQATRDLGAVKVNGSVNASANAGGPVVVNLGAGADITVDPANSINLAVTKGLNGGGDSAVVGWRTNF